MKKFTNQLLHHKEIRANATTPPPPPSPHRTPPPTPHPSCSVGAHAQDGWCCHAAGCGARGAIYDLASALVGGPWGPALRGEAFARARARVAEAFGPAAVAAP